MPIFGNNYHKTSQNAEPLDRVGIHQRDPRVLYRAFPDILLGESEEDKVTVSRARKVQRFLTQPFFVAETFTGTPGKYVSMKDTIRGFKEILDGKHDEIPEQAFYMTGSIEEVLEKASAMTTE